MTPNYLQIEGLADSMQFFSESTPLPLLQRLCSPAGLSFVWLLKLAIMQVLPKMHFSVMLSEGYRLGPLNASKDQ